MFIRPEDVNGYRVPGLPALNESQMNFFIAIMNGEPETPAYIKAYKPENTDSKTVAQCVHAIKKSKWYNGYKDYYEGVMEQRVLNESTWNLELSILERKRLYHLNLLEVERLAGAHQKAIDYYMRKRQEAIENDDEEKIEKYEEKIIKETKAKNMAIASNQACQEALEGLDKLMGLQTVNVHHTSGVKFVGGEDMWDDGISDSGTEEG